MKRGCIDRFEGQAEEQQAREHGVGREGARPKPRGQGSIHTFLRRFEGRDGDDDSAIASLRRSRRARWARFCGEGIVLSRARVKSSGEESGGVNRSRCARLAAWLEQLQVKLPKLSGQCMYFRTECDTPEYSCAPCPEHLESELAISSEQGRDAAEHNGASFSSVPRRGQRNERLGVCVRKWEDCLMGRTRCLAPSTRKSGAGSEGQPANQSRATH